MRRWAVWKQIWGLKPPTQISPPSALGELLLAFWLFCCCLGAFYFILFCFQTKSICSPGWP